MVMKQELRVDPARPMEELMGGDRGVVRIRLGNMHALTSFREAARACRPKNIRKAPVALRRGLLLLVWQTLQENRRSAPLGSAGAGVVPGVAGSSGYSRLHP